MNNIYISGDSFCYYRSANDWPYIVAKQLELTLQGQGFPGDSWWLTRQHLLQYLKSPAAQDTQVFILCHTDPFRPLTGQQLFKNSEAEIVKKNYFKYFVDYDISLWAVQNWYQELNQLLQGRRVLHFQSFASSEKPFGHLQGQKVITPLVELSLFANPEIDFMNDPRRNHFDIDHNQKFADLVLECLDSNQKELQISFESAATA
jgi:hypothetical protein